MFATRPYVPVKKTYSRARVSWRRVRAKLMQQRPGFQKAISAPYVNKQRGWKWTDPKRTRNPVHARKSYKRLGDRLYGPIKKAWWH